MSKWTAKSYAKDNGIYTIENEHGATIAKVGDKKNAERIASTPDLYNALIEMLKNSESTMENLQYRKLAIEALAKYEGK
jgi:hypothetical protein